MDLVDKTSEIISDVPSEKLSISVANTLEKYLFNYSNESSLLIKKEIHNMQISNKKYNNSFKSQLRLDLC